MLIYPCQCHSFQPLFIPQQLFPHTMSHHNLVCGKLDKAWPSKQNTTFAESWKKAGWVNKMPHFTFSRVNIHLDIFIAYVTGIWGNFGIKLQNKYIAILFSNSLCWEMIVTRISTESEENWPYHYWQNKHTREYIPNSAIISVPAEAPGLVRDNDIHRQPQRWPSLSLLHVCGWHWSLNEIIRNFGESYHKHIFRMLCLVCSTWVST